MRNHETTQAIESDSKSETAAAPKKLALERTVVRRMMPIRGSTIRAGHSGHPHGPADPQG
ncbi:MAG: hypothetical protein ACLQVI_18880 [Polyangiaceae bacterium]|jgi:hypothetical protein